jgi:D-alanyl-D-alanine dipeptidase
VPNHTIVTTRNTFGPEPRALSDYDYTALTTNPDDLEVPVDPQPVLPAIIATSGLPLNPMPPARDHEPLVAVHHHRIQSIPTYWNAGWSAASPEVWVRLGVAEALCRVASRLSSDFGLAILDAWRSLELQSEIYTAAYSDDTLPPGFVTPPSQDPQTPPPHLTGGTVDVTLTWKGHPLGLGTLFDDFTDAARVDSLENVTCRSRELRRMLYWAMKSEDFTVIDCEWWHFELGTRRWAALTGRAPWYAAANFVQ